MAKIPLSNTSSALRNELRAAQKEAKKAGDIWFLIEDIEVELQVVVSANAQGEVGFSVLGVDLGGVSGDVNRETVQRVRLKMGARGADQQARVFAGDEDDD
jgi:hypothetical protein